MNKRLPGPINIYKTSAAAQFTFMPPRWASLTAEERENGKPIRIEKNGSILLEVAKGEKNGENISYSWDKKINIALGINDFTLIVNKPETPPRLVHDTPNSPLIKALEFIPGVGEYVGTFRMVLSEKNEDTNENRSIMVPLTQGEYSLFLKIFLDMIPRMVGWNEG